MPDGGTASSLALINDRKGRRRRQPVAEQPGNEASKNGISDHYTKGKFLLVKTIIRFNFQIKSLFLFFLDKLSGNPCF